MKLRDVWAVFFVAFVLAAGCSAGTGEHPACTKTSDCGPQSGCDGGGCRVECLYQVGSCFAHGECIAVPPGAPCNAVFYTCGCGTKAVRSGCNGIPEGYATAPTTGALSACD